MSAFAPPLTKDRCRPAPIWNACADAGGALPEGLQRDFLRPRRRHSDRLRRYRELVRQHGLRTAMGRSATSRRPARCGRDVYRTPLLYELIKGCQNDLARVESVRWGPRESDGDGWPDDVPWEEFAEALRRGPEIAFTRPVRIDTVHPGSVFLTAVLWERQADYMLTRRIPSMAEPLDEADGYASRFRLRINRGWLRNEIDSRSELRSGGRDGAGHPRADAPRPLQKHA